MEWESILDLSSQQEINVFEHGQASHVKETHTHTHTHYTQAQAKQPPSKTKCKKNEVKEEECNQVDQ